MKKSGENLGVILAALGLSSVAVIGLVVWGSKRAAEGGGGDFAKPVGAFPGLKVGSVVQVDAARANVVASANAPTFVAQVDLLMTDPALVSVRGLTTEFRGTIPRAAILRELAAPAPGVFV